MNNLSKKIIPLTLLSLSTFAANSASHYVAPNGSNNNDGSQNNPFATISYASTKAQPGDKVVIMAGTYFEHVQIQSSGLSGQPITYVGEAGAIVDGSNTEMDHDDNDGLFVIAGQSYIIVDGITVKNTNHHGISVNAGNTSNTITDVTIKNCRTENTDGAGIIAYGSYPFVKYQINNIHIENNEVITPQQGRFNGNNRWHEDITIGGGAENFIISGNHVDAQNSEDWNGGPLGIDAKDGVKNGKIFNNHVENIPSQGIYVDAGKDGAYNIEVYQNRVHGISGYGVIVGGEEAGEVDNVKIHDNIVYNTGWSGVMVDNFLRVNGSAQDKTNIHIFNNTLHNTGYLNEWAGGIQAAAGTSGKVYNNVIDVSSNPMDVSPGNYEVTNNCINNAPGFVDTANADFHLQSASPCINAGASIEETVNTPEIIRDEPISETPLSDSEISQVEPNVPPSTSLTTPTAIAPQGETTNLSPTYQWKAVAGATSYTLGMEDPVTETGWREYTMTSAEANCSDVTQPCTYTPQETLTTGDKIAWWIKAINTNGETPYVGWGTEFQVTTNLSDGGNGELCTTEYAPVCGKVQVQCVTTPCEPIEQTFPNLCNLDGNPHAEYLREGECDETANTNNSQAKIFIIGDSTVHNTDEGEQGWGSSLNQYMRNPENVFNQARAGASSKSFKVEQSWTDHDWSNTKDLINQADTSNGAYLFIQFGHNDEVEEGEENYTALTTSPGRGNSFYTHLTTYIDEAKSMGVIPVLITPVEGMLKNTGEQTAQFHGEYAQTIRDLAEDKNVLLLDLQQKSWSEFNNYNNTEELRAVFGHDDVVHFSPNGAASIAGWIKELICESDSVLCTQFE